jgi:hypothetical protein
MFTPAERGTQVKNCKTRPSADPDHVFERGLVALKADPCRRREPNGERDNKALRCSTLKGGHGKGLAILEVCRKGVLDVRM